MLMKHKIYKHVILFIYNHRMFFVEYFLVANIKNYTILLRKK